MSVLEKQHVFIFVRIFIKHLLVALHIISLLFMNKEEKFFVVVQSASKVSIKTDISEESKNYFTDLKKLLIQYYYVDNTGLLMDNFLQKIDNKKVEVQCTFSHNFLSIKTDISEESKDYFTNLKKLLIQYYYVYDTGLLMDNFLQKIDKKKVEVKCTFTHNFEKLYIY